MLYVEAREIVLITFSCVPEGHVNTAKTYLVSFHSLTFFILFLVEKSLAKINCLLVCPQGQKNIDFNRRLVLTIDGRNTVGTWVIDGGESESEVSLTDLIKLNQIINK